MPPRLLSPEARRSRLIQAAVIAVLIGAAALVNPDHPLPIDICFFKRLTGLPCPTCGLTRALCHALRGNWTESVAYHPAGPLAAMVLAGWTTWLAAEAMSGRVLAEPLRTRLGASLVYAGAALSVVSWIARLGQLLVKV